MASEDGGGIAERLARIGDAALGTAQTRLALFAVEVEEEGLRLGTALFHLILAALFTGFGLLALAVFVTVWLWDSHRLVALGVDSLLFLGLGAWTAAQAQRRLAGGTRLFRDSIAELERDRDALRGRHD